MFNMKITGREIRNQKIGNRKRNPEIEQGVTGREIRRTSEREGEKEITGRDEMKKPEIAASGWRRDEEHEQRE